MKRILSMLLALALILAYLPALPIHAETVASGTCGDNLTWKLDGEGILTISGDGAMADYNYGMSPWYSYRDSINSVVIGNQVTEIGRNAFTDCKNLTAVQIPDSVTVIDVLAFYRCSGLTALELPASLITIGSCAFSDCSGLRKVEIPATVTSIGSSGFSGCESLTEVEIPASVTTLGESVFEGCSNLKEIRVAEENTKYSNDSYGVLFNKAKTILEEYPGGRTGSYTIPDSVIKIAKSSFLNCTNLTAIHIPTSVTCVESNAFNGCSGLNSLQIPNSVTKINDGAFSYCTGVTALEIPASVTYMGDYALSGSTGLREITFRGNAPTFGGQYTFRDLQITAKYPGNDPSWTEEVRQNYGGSITWKGYTTGAAIVAQGTCGDNLTWKLDAEGTLTVSGTGYMDDYDEDPAPWKDHKTEIKKIILEEGVKDIGDDAFYGCSALTTVEMADSVIGIGSYAFAECGKLQHISIGAGVTNIRSFAFNGCDSLVAFSVDERNTVFSNDDHGVLFNKEKTTLITAPATLSGAYTVPEGVLSLSAHAFNGCTGMTAVALPDSLTTIGDYAFLDCAGLKAIEIPGKVTYIGSCAFFYCYGLDEIRFCGNIPSMADFAFSTVTAKAYYPGNNATWTSDRLKGYQGSITWTPYGPAIVAEGTCGDNLTWKLDAEGTLTISGTGAMTEFASVSYVPWYEHRDAIKTVNVQNGVTTLGSDAFRQCANLSSITLPNSVTSIGSNAFCGCYALTEITIPAGVTEIAYSTFYACTGLTKITIPEGVTTIGAEAFNNCSSLTEITLPAGVTSIGDLAFNKCSKLADVHIPNSVVTIGKNAFANCTSLTGIDLPDSLIRIEESLFYYCTGLTSVEIPDSVTEIGFSAFDHCTALAEIDLGEGVELIEKYAFDSCTSLTKITIPDSITTIGNNIFYDCGNVQFNTYENGKYLGNAGNPYIALIRAADTSVSSCEVNANTRVIAGGAFSGCENLASVTIPTSVVSICQYAFYNCSTLAEVFYGGSATQWESVAIGNYNQALLAATLHTTTSGTCGDNLTWVLTEDGTLTISGTGAMDNYNAFEQAPWYDDRGMILSVRIEDGVTTIGNGAFSYCSSLESVTIPEGVTTLGESVFSDCSSLESVTIPDSVTTIGNGAFSHCTSLKSVIIPDSVTNIGDFAFVFCSSLENVTISNSVTTINSYIFRGCTSLKSVTIPTGVTGIAACAFEDCTGLESVTIPDGVLGIAEGVFANCSSLKSVTIPDSVIVIGVATFANCSSLESVIIPDSVTIIDDLAFAGCSGLEEIVFQGDAPTVRGDDIFEGLQLTAYYPANDASWTEEVRQNYGGELTWVAYVPIVAEGTCGENLTWQLDEEGTLTISGNGAMDNYTSQSPAPWQEHQNAIQKVILEEGITTIGNRAFEGYSQLTTLELPSTLTSIGQNAFYTCYELTHVALPASITKLGSNAFTACRSLTGFTVDANNPNFSSDPLGVLFNKDQTMLIYYPGDRTGAYEIPDTVTEIGMSAFYACAKLTDVTMPASVTKVKNGAFTWCDGLKEITFQGNAPVFEGDYIFDDVTATVNYPADRDGWTEEVRQNYGGNLTWKPYCIETHTEVTDKAVPVTCTTDGKTEGKHCSVCGEILISQEVIPSQGHKYIPQVTAPTCTADGYTTYTCSCADTYTADPVTRLGHDMGQWYTVTELTCTQDGETRRDCSRCDHHETQVTKAQGHKYTAQVTAPTCTTDGYTTYTCSCTDTYTADPVAQLGHEWGSWRQEIAPTPYGEGVERRDCGRCDEHETRSLAYHGTGLKLPAEQFAGHSTVWVDGLPYAIQGSGEERYVEIPQGNHSLVTYTYQVGDGQDVHTQYPTGMKVYMVSDGKLTYVPELDDLLQYSGSSIRIVGKKGIRMITSLTKDNKKALTGKGLAGYKLLEYGTALCFANEIPPGDGLVLGRSYTRSNYAYKKGEADPVFASPGNLIQYTNVLVGFSLDQCKEDIAMRPYIILEDGEGNQVTLYGGTIYRSIGYIAYQNRSVFQPKTAAYDYVWELIHHVYGDKYDADYKG